MFQLIVVAGPSRGAAYTLSEGETRLGRQSGNPITIVSGKISKQHCAFLTDDAGVLVQDLNSSNGTFVNGILVKVKRLVPGDRITAGDVTLELTRRISSATTAGPRLSLEQAPLQGQIIAYSAPPVSLNSNAGSVATPSSQRPAETPVEKIRVAVESKVMPIFYNMLLKNEWRLVVAAIFGIFAVGNLMASLFPVLQANEDSILREARRRAVFMSRQMAEQNASILATGQESKTHTAGAETGDFVRTAYLTDLDLRVLAPAKMANQYFVAGPEAVFAKKASVIFKNGNERGVSGIVAGSIVVAVEPVKVYVASRARNETIAMAVVALDASPAIPNFADLSLVYSETLVLSLILGALLYFVLYRVTLKPFEVLNEDMDRVLKGDLAQVTHEFKWEELNSLWDLVRSALQRATRSAGAGGGDMSGLNGGASVEQVAAPFRIMGAQGMIGAVVCDAQGKVVYMSPLFEEISGIRADSAVGQDLVSLARDQSFGALVTDLFTRSPSAGDGVSEDYDFSGIAYKVHASAVGQSGAVTALVLIAQRAGQEAAA